MNYTQRDFAWVRWKPEDIKVAFRNALAYKRAAYARIKKIPAKERTFQNTVLAIEESDYADMDPVDYAEFLMHVSPVKEIRECVKREYDRFAKTLIDVELDPKLYEAVKTYAMKKEKLGGPSRKLLHEMLRSYRRSGLNLSPAKQKRIRANFKRLESLETSFDKNIADHKDSIVLTEKETEGLPQTYLKGLKRDKKGRYVVTLAYPDYFPFIQNSSLLQKRKELIDKQLRKGGRKNNALLEKILNIRLENAKLLGYKSHADFTLETKMAKNPLTAQRFLDSLAAKLRKRLSKEFAELAAFKRELTGDPHAKLDYYDISSSHASYYINKLKEKKYGVDDEKVREYFPFQLVKEGVLDIYAKLFSVRFERVSDQILWSKGVELYAVKEKGEQRIAYFFLDLYPREGKYGHAAMFPLAEGRQEGDAYGTPVAALVTNFREPAQDRPSLLSHDEVVTFFHEFGHVMHHVLTKAKYASQSGSHVVRDFVEAPSQMLENWCWDPKILRLISAHYRNKNEKLPQKLLNQMIAAKHHMIAYDTIRQLGFGIFDLAIHTAGKQNAATTGKMYDNVILKLTGLKMPPNLFPAGFGHLMGYDAGYYGYLWSKVYAADMFTRFKKEGLLNAKTGMEYRRWILEKGSSEEAMALVKGFLKRKPNLNAFLKEIGL